MPALALLLPVVILAGGGLPVALLARRLPASARLTAALALWSALAVLLLLWVPTRSILDVDLGQLGAGLRFGIRLDALSFAMSVFILVPGCLLLTFGKVPAPARALLAIAAGLLAVQASGLVLASFAIALALALVGLLMQGSEGGLQEGARLRGEAALLSLIWAATSLYAIAGTDQYAFVPVSTLKGPVLLLVATSALLISGLVPWRPWPVRFLERFQPGPAALAAAVFFPVGFNLLLRMYQAGDGQYPNRWFNIGLGLIGALVALTSALRAQAAATRRAHLAEGLPMAGGFALMALGLGTPLGIAAAMAILAAGALLVPLTALLPAAPGGRPALALAVVAGLPPTLIFASRLLGVEAAVTANEVFAYAGVAAAIAWLLGLAAAARAVRLPPGGSGEGSATGLAVTVFLLAVGGVFVGYLQVGLANPAAATVMSVRASVLGGGLLGTDTAAGNWPAVSLGGLLLLALALTAALAARPGGRVLEHFSVAEPGAPPAPIVVPTWRRWPDLVGELVDSFEIPAEYRFTGWQSLDRAMARASIWFWVASFAVLAVALLR